MAEQKKTKPCPLCGGPMHRQSAKCRSCWGESHARPESYLSRACLKCGTPFVVHKSQVARGQGTFCSRRCARSGSPTRKRTSVQVSCQTCGDEFQKHRSEIRKTQGDFHFCTPTCWYSFNQKDNHALWQGGQSGRMSSEGLGWRRAILARDHYCCRICHSPDELEAHHILPFAEFEAERWDVGNGLLLCRGCHTQFRCRELEYAEVLSQIAAVPIEDWSSVLGASSDLVANAGDIPIGG